MSLGTEYDEKSRSIPYPKVGDMISVTDYRLKQNELKEEFKEKLFEIHGIENHRKRINCFELACEYGHSNGYEIIEEHFNNFVELLK